MEKVLSYVRPYICPVADMSGTVGVVLLGMFVLTEFYWRVIPACFSAVWKVWTSVLSLF